MIPRPPRSTRTDTLFPYTTLFRSEAAVAGAAPGAGSMTASFLGDDYLEIRGLTVDFDGFKAVQGVDVTFMEGRLHFLIGPNGAGKTTLVDALTGLSPGTGPAEFRGRDLPTMKRTEERSLGQEWVSTCRSRWSP